MQSSLTNTSFADIAATGELLPSSSQRCYTNLSEALGCYISIDDGVYKYQLAQEDVSTPGLTIRTYILNSQNWPPFHDQDIATTTWQHRLVLYVPTTVSHNQALLYVTGGYNNDQEGKEHFTSPKEVLNYAQIASNNHAPVVVLEDVPNQYLLIDGKPKKEDQILAFTYKKVMQDPYRNAYLAGHLPMAKAIIKAMDAAQDIMQTEHNLSTESFIVAGASKRGWALWLAALSDERISAIIPMVVDILNVQANINHICGSYKNVCPPALRDYHAEGLDERFNSTEFADLMQIEDPFAYLPYPQYAARFSIPKYIINASGDDFYVPDSAKFYYHQLPGNNYVRYLPAAMHYFAGNPISDAIGNNVTINNAINSYFYFILHNTDLPKVTWNFSPSSIHITSSVVPSAIKLWVAHNENERDFRYLTSYTKWHLGLKTAWLWLTQKLGIKASVCDTCYEERLVTFNCESDKPCNIDVPLNQFDKGWQASFAELHYNIDGQEFVITTTIGITPDTYPVA
jgi:PhoPQ-activated pathogenicity-related protein